MNQRKHITSGFFLCLLAWALLLPPGVQAQPFDTPMKAVDHFFETVAQPQADTRSDFSDQGMITALRYDSAGNPSYLSYTPDSFQAEIRNLSKNFEVAQEPVVIVYREYMSVASVFCSVWSRFVDRANADTLVSRSIQSFKLVRMGSEWKINHLCIQNENPAYPLDEDMWPAEITAQLTAESGPGNNRADEVYDPTRVYNTTEVDEAPVYPGNAKVFEDLMKLSNVQTAPAPGFDPFTIVIAEDGQASLDNTEGLSNYQHAKAETFVRSMLIWYPAILDAASVKCKLTFYIRE